MEQSPWEANWLNLQLIKKFPAFYGNRKFITVLTSARHLSLSWANSIQSPQSLPTSPDTLIIRKVMCRSRWRQRRRVKGWRRRRRGRTRTTKATKTMESEERDDDEEEDDIKERWRWTSRKKSEKKAKDMLVMKYNGQRRELKVSKDLEGTTEGRGNRKKDAWLRFETRTFWRWAWLFWGGLELLRKLLKQEGGKINAKCVIDWSNCVSLATVTDVTTRWRIDLTPDRTHWLHLLVEGYSTTAAVGTVAAYQFFVVEVFLRGTYRKSWATFFFCMRTGNSRQRRVRW